MLCRVTLPVPPGPTPATPRHQPTGGKAVPHPHHQRRSAVVPVPRAAAPKPRAGRIAVLPARPLAPQLSSAPAAG